MQNSSNAEFTETKLESNSHLQQLLRLKIAHEKCYAHIKSDPPIFTSGLWCNRTWDGVTCWGDTNASTTASQKCPSYIHGFNKFDLAFRRCTETGEWYRSSRTNKTWTDYSQCILPHKSLHDHINNILGIANFGYAASLVSLSAAIIIMVSCRRFYYKSNILHINLFLAFCFRAFFSLLRQNLFTHGYAMTIDMEQDGGELKFKDGPHWECRLLFTFFMYGLCVSQVWVFVEGLYLQMLIYRTLFTQQRSVKFYITFGWCFPLTFLLPWVLVRVYYDNTLCWSVNKKLKYVWITRGPITVTILINFLFFLDNLRVLLQRTRARGNNRTYRKFAKFTAMLVPLFGVPNVLFMMIPPHINTTVDVPYLYISMLYSSFQGLILALLFCFLHEEVHANIKRTFNRFMMRQRSTMNLRSSTSLFFSQRHSSITTQNTQYPNTEINDSIQLHSIHTNKLCSYKGKVCNKPSNNGANADLDGCTGFISSINALTQTFKCSLSDQPMNKQMAHIPFERSDQPMNKQMAHIPYERSDQPMNKQMAHIPYERSDQPMNKQMAHIPYERSNQPMNKQMAHIPFEISTDKNCTI